MTKTLEQTVAELAAKQEITDAIHRIARGTDRGDVALFASGYHDDADDFHGVSNGPVSGVFVTLTAANKVFLVSHHAVSNIDIQLDGDAAHVESYFDAFHRRSDDTGVWDEYLKGRYVDRFERRNGAWKVATRLCSFDWTHVEPASTTDWLDATGVPRSHFITGRRDREDVLYAKKPPSGI